VADELEDLVGAVAKDEVLGADAKLLREAALEVKGVPVGVKMEVVQGLLHGGERGGRGAEGVLVGGELDDVGSGEAEFSGDLLNGPAGLIHRKAGESGVEGERGRHGAKEVKCDA
jgi:hypothetical protein